MDGVGIYQLADAAGQVAGGDGRVRTTSRRIAGPLPELLMNTAAATAEQEVEHLLQNLPDDVTSEGIQYDLHVLEKIKRGLDDVAAGRVSTVAQARERLGRWLQS